MRLLGAVTNLQLLWFGEQHRDLDGPRDHVLSGETCRQGSVRPRKKHEAALARAAPAAEPEVQPITADNYAAAALAAAANPHPPPA